MTENETDIDALEQELLTKTESNNITSIKMLNTGNQEVPVTNESCSIEQPKGVSDKMWQKFQTLQKRRLQVTKKSTERRIKKLKADVMQKVESEFVQEEDIDVLREHDVELPSCSTSQRLKIADHGEVSTQSKTSDTKYVEENEEKWKSVKKYLTCNDHLKGLDKGKYAPKTKLEDNIDKAIADGEYKKAENLSDHLADREFGKKIADAFDAKTYADGKQEEQVKAKEKRKKKLPWGFEHKQRWETKSNM